MQQREANLGTYWARPEYPLQERLSDGKASTGLPS